MPRFALLDHDHPQSHFDLMLERDGVLWTWRLAEVPAAGVAMPALRIGEHRLAYLDYEGPVSGDRGRVMCVDRGALTWLDLEATTIRVHVEGQRLHGELLLALVSAPLWSVIYRPG